MKMFARTGRMLAPVLLTGSLVACTDSEPTRLCEEETRRCLKIETRDFEYGGIEWFAVQLTNTCYRDIEYKLCFEVSDETADCRQGTLAPSRRTEERIALSRFGGRTRVFVRYLSEAKACRFPLTRDVDF